MERYIDTLIETEVNLLASSPSGSGQTKLHSACPCIPLLLFILRYSNIVLSKFHPHPISQLERNTHDNLHSDSVFSLISRTGFLLSIHSFVPSIKMFPPHPKLFKINTLLYCTGLYATLLYSTVQ